MKKETRGDRFKRVAEKRVENTLKSIRSLSQLSNGKVYEWNDEQIDRIFSAIETELEKCKKNFKDPDGEVFKL